MRDVRSRAVLLLTILLAGAWPVAAEPGAPDEAFAHPGVSGFDMSVVLLSLARGHPDVLSLLSPLQGSGAKAIVPTEIAARLDAPPPLAQTLAALGAPLLTRAPALTAELDGALSLLGQGILGAEELRATGKPYEGAILLRDAYERARPTLERDAMVLLWSDAYSRAAWNATATLAELDALARATTTRDALAATGIGAAPAVEPQALDASLAALYARLGLPVDRATRAALAASLGLDPALRAPLELALAHVDAAWALRDEALAGAAGLALAPDAIAAMRRIPPTPEDLAVLAAYGRSAARLDEAKMRAAASHLVAAADALAMREGSAPLFPCCGGAEHDAGAGRRTLAIGGLIVSFDPSGEGDVLVRVEQGSGETDLGVYPNAAVAFDVEHASVVIYSDEDGDGTHDWNEPVMLDTPALARRESDVLFMDPYGFVLVTGEGSTRVDAGFGRRVVEASWGSALPGVPATGARSVLDGIDAQLAPHDATGAWAAMREPLRRLAQDPEAPTRVKVTVNPASYQILHLDMGGDDTYLTNAGGAGKRGMLAIEADGPGEILAENATASPLPAAILVDLAGDDRYETRGDDTLASANASVALLRDAGGRDAFIFNGTGHGLGASATGGVALLVSGPGDASFRAGDGGLAYAAGHAVALVVDEGGDDTYRGQNASLAASDLGALAALVDLSGNDTYTSRAFSQAASRGGVALLLDGAGIDGYDAAQRGDAQGYAEPYDRAGIPCLAPDMCPAVLGPARAAILLDHGGTAAGACGASGAQNAALGGVVIAEAPIASAFNPAFGLCAHSEPAVDGGQEPGSEIAIPPTFFASSFANFTIPGLARLGGLGNDTVEEPFLLNVDLLGSDTYRVGALARVDISRLDRLDLGLFAPVSLHVDTDGNDVHEARRDLPGAFGYADGGIALHATTSTYRFLVDEERLAHVQDTRYLNEGTSAWEPNLTDRAGSAMHLVATNVSHVHAYRNVSVGMAAAQNGGVAMLVRDGIRIDVSAAPSAAPCRLACARAGGVALAIGRGPGDLIVASPWSLGAVKESALGGLAVYYQRGGRDTYGGSNASMGRVERDPNVLDPANALGPAAEKRPNVALFVKDGYEQDLYLPEWSDRGNNRFWEDRDTIDSFHAFGNRSLHVAQGIDDLDWYANANVAAADEGFAEDTGPGVSGEIETPVGPAPNAYDAMKGGCDVLAPAAAVRNNCFTALNNPISRSIFSTYNATLSSGENVAVPLGVELGRGDSTTSPDGIRPVTFARTPFNPIVNISTISFDDEGVLRWLGSPAWKVGTGADVRIEAYDPPAFADQTLFATLAPPQGASATDVQRGASISRIELSVLGTDGGWSLCPIAKMRDPHDARACRVAWWDREIHGSNGFTLPDHTNVTLWAPPSRSDYQAKISSPQILVREDGAPLFPAGNYTIVARGYAARPYGIPSYNRVVVENAALEGLHSEALNVTDDNYGLYGSSYFAHVRFLPIPQLISARQTIVASNGHAPAVFAANVTEPLAFTVEIVPAPGMPDTGREAFPVAYSELYEDTAAFEARGHDRIRFEWNASGRPDGQYTAFLNMTGKLWGVENKLTRLTLDVDRKTPQRGVDPRGMPEILNASTSEGGAIRVTMDQAEVRAPASAASKVYLWLMEEVLDAADPGIVLERIPWRLVDVWNGTTQTTALHRTTGRPTAFNVGTYAADPTPGPPRLYHFAAYVVDMAGNVRVDDPARHKPMKADCVEVCATFLYDVTPPRTRAVSTDPFPEVGRFRQSAIQLRVDASQTPDIAAQRTHAALLSPSEEALYEPAFLGIPKTAAPKAVKPNATLELATGTRLLGAPNDVLIVNETRAIVVNVTSADVNGFTRGRPLYARVNVTDPDMSATISGPFEINLTGQLDKTQGFPWLGATTPGAVLRIPGIVMPNASGVYTLSLTLFSPKDTSPDATMSTNFTEIREGLVVWDELPQPDANGTIGWAPPSWRLQHGHALVVLSRGVDRAGNVEEKVAYDQRLEIDLVPPALSARPSFTPMATAVSVVLETDEPSLGVLRVLNESGDVVSVELATASNVHATTLTGLLPDRPYTLVAELRDEVGNAANASVFNETPLTFTTTRALDLTLAPMPPLVAANASVAWTLHATEATPLAYELALSIDGGASFPHVVTTSRAVEEGNASRSVQLDAARFPESASAQLRLVATPLDTPEAPAIAYSTLFTIDAQAPVTNASAAKGLSEHVNASVTLALDASDEGSGVAAIEWSRDNRTFAPVTDGTILVEGDAPTTIFARARDKAGNIEAARPVRVLLDRAPPIVTARAAAGLLVSTDVVAIEITGTDAAAGIATIVGTDDAGEAFRIEGADLVAGRASAIWDLGDREGSRTLAVRATDGAGNTAETSVALRADRTPPRAAVKLVERALDRLVVEIEMSEPARLAATLSSRLGARTLDVPGNARGSFRLELGELRSGTEHTLEIRARDEAGNLAIVTRTFSTTLDQDAPGVARVLRATLVRDGAILVAWNAAKDDGTLATYHVLRGEDPDDVAPIASTEDPRFLDVDVIPGTTYFYRVVAMDDAGNLGERSPMLEARSRTAPSIRDLGAFASPTGVRIEARVQDADADPPSAEVALGNASIAARFEPVEGGWLLVADVPLERTGLADARAFHVEITDGHFTARAPAIGEVRLPAFAGAEDPAESRGLLGAQLTPAPGILAVIALVALLALFRRRIP